MGGFDEYEKYDGLGLADLIKRGEVPPSEVLEAAIRLAEKINPRINAVIYKMYDHARRIAAGDLPAGPFSGVPFLLKDMLAALADFPMAAGSRALKNYVPEADSEIVKRFKSAGLVIWGKANCPEFGLLAVTEPERFGPTRNPWNLERTPGGSSGGSAAAIASGMVPMASAGDGGGSIRIPASCCGLFGLKPSRGRNPTGPYFGNVWQGAAVEHVITRTVRDSAAVLDATCGPDIGAPYFLPAPEEPYLKAIEQPPQPLRIAFNTKSPLGTPVHPECVRAVEDAARLLEGLGHQVEEAAPEVNGKAIADGYIAMYFGEVAADIAALEPVLGRKPRPGDVEDQTWVIGLLGRAYSAGEFVTSLREWNHAARAMGAFHQTYDLYLIPTLAEPPVKIGAMQPKPAERAAMKVVNKFGLGRVIKMSGLPDKIATEGLSNAPFTQLANLTGQPAMSVPLYWTEDGLPCGVQFVAPLGDEATLFKLAAQLEKERPWFDRRPPGPA